MAFSPPELKLGTQVGFPEMADIKSPDLPHRLPDGGKIKIRPEIGDFPKAMIGYLHIRELFRNSPILSITDFIIFDFFRGGCLV